MIHHTSRPAIRRLAIPFLLGILLIAALPAQPSLASLVIPTTLSDRIKLATMVFAGTVTAVDYGHEEGVGIVSKVTFGDIRYAKSAGVSSSLILTVRGGREVGRWNGKTGTFESWVDGLPRFKVGDRYILFLLSLGTPNDDFVPILSLGEGAFLVHPAENGGARTVHDFQNRPLSAVTPIGIEVVDLDASQPQENTDSRRDTVRFMQPWERKGNLTPKTRPLGRIIDVKAVEERAPRGVIGSVHTATGQEVLRVLTRAADPGRRITEQVFLDVVRSVSADK
jgi:hypothetical protein